jgi:hypothetical protein
MGRVLVLFAFTSQMGQQYPTDAWKFWDIYHAVLKGTEYEYFNRSHVSDWSISFVTSYLIGQSFCVSIGQLFMKWSFLIGSFSSILIGGSLGENIYLELTEWNGSKRVDLRFWKDATVPTKEGVSLHLDQWKALCNMSDSNKQIIHF